MFAEAKQSDMDLDGPRSADEGAKGHVDGAGRQRRARGGRGRRGGRSALKRVSSWPDTEKMAQARGRAMHERKAALRRAGRVAPLGRTGDRRRPSEGRAAGQGAPRERPGAPKRKIGLGGSGRARRSSSGRSSRAQRIRDLADRSLGVEELVAWPRASPAHEPGGSAAARSLPDRRCAAATPTPSSCRAYCGIGEALLPEGRLDRRAKPRGQLAVTPLRGIHGGCDRSARRAAPRRGTLRARLPARGSARATRRRAPARAGVPPEAAVLLGRRRAATPTSAVRGTGS